MRTRGSLRLLATVSVGLAFGVAACTSPQVSEPAPPAASSEPAPPSATSKTPPAASKAPATGSKASSQGAFLFAHVHVFDGVNQARVENANVLVEGNLIKKISTSPIEADEATVIDGGGRTLMPGLIDAHWHTTYAYIPPNVYFGNPPGDILEVAIRSMKGAEATLLRGFTTVRDPGGNSFAIKKLIDSGEIPGHRILASGPFMSQTSVHADFRSNIELPENPGAPLNYWEKNMVAMVADGVPEVRKRTREILRYGATQIKITTGGGVSSLYDPLDVFEYSMDEIGAVVEAAENWNTYVLSHVMNDKGVRKSVEAGVKSIEHGFFASDDTLQLMKEKGVWLSPQPLLYEDFNFTDPIQLKKLKEATDAVATLYPRAKKIGVRIAFGTDQLFDPAAAANQGALLARLGRWFSPYEALKIATSENAALLEMAGPRHPYQEGPLGVVQEGAYADLILVDGNPLENLDLVADPHTNFVVIMKDGKVFKNTLN